MHRIDTPTAQVDKFGLGKNGFTRGNPQTGTPATELDDDYFDMLQEELAGIVENAGIVLDKTKHNQLLTALQTVFQSRDATLTAIAALTGSANKLAYFNGADTAALSDFTDIGRNVVAQTSIANLLAYLGLGTAATKSVGTGANQIPDMNSFTSLKAGSNSNGWQALPSGLIIQWYTGTHPGDSTAWSYNFPIPFPNAFLADSVVVAGATNNRSYINGSASSNTSRSWIVSRDVPGVTSISSIVVGW